MSDAWLRPTYRDVCLLFCLFFPIFGSTYAFLIPPFQVPDERAHWLTAHHDLARAVTGSGTVCSTDVALDRHFRRGIQFRPERRLPAGIFAQVGELEPECEEERLYPTGNLLSYPGVLLTRLLVPREPTSGRQSLFGFYLARLLHGVLIALLLARVGWLARASPEGPPGHLALLLLALTPLFVQQSFAVTIDVVTNAFALAVCAWLVFCERLTRLDRAVLLALGAMTALGKPVLAVMLLPLLALGLYLEHLRRFPDAPSAPWPALKQRIAAQRTVVAALSALALVGLLYAQDFSLSSGRAARQLEAMEAEPWRALRALGAGVWKLFAHPSLFLDYLGYLDLRVSDGTLRDFGRLALGVGVLEGLALGAGVAGLLADPVRRRQLRAAAPTVALLGGLALAAVGVGIGGVALHAYLVFTAPGRLEIASFQPRYLFPHGIIALGIAMALARTLLARPPSPAATPHARRGLSRLARGALLVLCGAQLLALLVHLSIDLRARYG